MNRFVALNTHWNNIKPAFLGVGPMVVLLGLTFFARTHKRVGAWEPAGGDCIAHGDIGFDFFWETFFAFGIAALLGSLALLAGVITFLGGFAFFCGFISLHALLAMVLETVFAGFMLVKFRAGLESLAIGAGLCYSGFRHLLLLFRSKCLELIAAHTAVGSLYYSEWVGRIKHIFTRSVFHAR